ncbi:MAG: acetate--CoA ligase, partial [Porticoccus sp.]|nr:acetate--CoA ligase [Porticoccus sp.]MBQ0807565.1 acetate--CoA ligase [Porticoccus sp.]
MDIIGEKLYPVSDEMRCSVQLNVESYERMYKASIETPDQFWSEQASQFLSWDKPWDKVNEYDVSRGETRWFLNGQLNVSANCLDRHLGNRGDQVAIIWEGDDPEEDRKITYAELHDEVCRVANVLKFRGIKRGDRVCIYMGMVPEVAVAMLACTRIGAIHSVVFGGFSAEALKDRILGSDCQAVITMDEAVRSGKFVPMKANLDKIIDDCPNVGTVLVVKRTGAEVAWREGRDLDYQSSIDAASPDCPYELMDAEDPLFILYTSGSTGKPKGVVHSTAGYLLQATMTHQYLFDYREGDVFWCTADVGWITGHSYIVYGPLCHGAITVMFEGVPTYPDASRLWEVVDKHQVNSLYTAPTLIRALMAQGDEMVSCTSRDSLRLLGSVGEPINPEAWEWYYRVVGEERCPVIDTWWQTETGAAMIAPLPGVTALKPGSATLPLFGVKPVLLDADGNILDGAAQGNLAISGSWPGQIRTVYGDHQRLIDTYFSTYPGYYFTGDGARRDEDGYYWITGRVDDVINVSGHRMGT